MLSGARSSSRRLVSLALGSLIASALVSLSMLGTSACSTQETTPAPDAAPTPCNRGPFILCEPTTPDQAGCNTDDGKSTWLTRVPHNTRYPLGCVINFVGERDPQGDCSLEAVCKCVIGELPSDGGTITPSADAGDAEAGTSTVSPAATGPIWNCYP